MARSGDPEWNNTTIISGDSVGDPRLKQPGQDIVQYGFGQLSYALLTQGLLDELQLWVHPLFVSQAIPPACCSGRPPPPRLTGTLALTRRVAEEKMPPRRAYNTLKPAWIERTGVRQCLHQCSTCQCHSTRRQATTVAMSSRRPRRQ